MEIKDYINDVSFMSPVHDRSKCIPIVLVCDSKNIPETMVTVSSISGINDDYYYDIVIIHNTLDEYDIAAFEHMAKSFDATRFKLRFDRVEHDFTKGYVHIDSNYKKEYILKCFLPAILKRYTTFLYVRSGNVLKSNVSQFYKAFTGEHEFKILSDGKFAEVVLYNSLNFRMHYTVTDIKKALTREIAELDVDFFRKLSGMTCTESPNEIVQVYENTSPSMPFKKLMCKVPYFEKWIYERYKINNGSNVAAEICAKTINLDFYLFPFELVLRGSKIVLYGNGKVGQQFRHQIEMTQFCELIAIVDRNVTEGILCLSELGRLKYDFVVIAVASDSMAREIRNDLMANGVGTDKIIYATERKL